METNIEDNNHKNNGFKLENNNDNHKLCEKRFSSFAHYVNIWFDNFTDNNFMDKHMLALKALSKIHGDKLTPEAAYKHAMRMFRSKMLMWINTESYDRDKSNINLQKWSHNVTTWIERGKYFWSGRKWICRNCEKGKCECDDGRLN